MFHRRRPFGLRSSAARPITNRKRPVRLWLEQLEDRTAPAVFVWDGGGGNTLWSNPANWDVGGANPAVAPGFTNGIHDDVVINKSGTYTVTLDVNIADTASGH